MHQKYILMGHLRSKITKLDYDFSKATYEDLIFVQQITLRGYLFSFQGI